MEFQLFTLGVIFWICNYCDAELDRWRRHGDRGPIVWEVIPLRVGFAGEEMTPNGEEMLRLDGSVTLVRGEQTNILVDTGGPWAARELLEVLEQHGLSACDVHYVIVTHGHADHVGNLNLFSSAMCIVSFNIFQGQHFFDSPLFDGEAYVISDDLEVIPTPGHTSNDVSLVIRRTELGTIVITGDLFENEDDLDDPDLWLSASDLPERQKQSRAKVLQIADYIVPGHGPMFQVQEKYKYAQSS